MQRDRLPILEEMVTAEINGVFEFFAPILFAGKREGTSSADSRAMLACLIEPPRSPDGEPLLGICGATESSLRPKDSRKATPSRLGVDHGLRRTRSGSRTFECARLASQELSLNECLIVQIRTFRATGLLGCSEISEPSQFLNCRGWRGERLIREGRGPGNLAHRTRNEHKQGDQVCPLDCERPVVDRS
jgi:hypothetical protein